MFSRMGKVPYVCICFLLFAPLIASHDPLNGKKYEAKEMADFHGLDLMQCISSAIQIHLNELLNYYVGLGDNYLQFIELLIARGATITTDLINKAEGSKNSQQIAWFLKQKLSASCGTLITSSYPSSTSSMSSTSALSFVSASMTSRSLDPDNDMVIYEASDNQQTSEHSRAYQIIPPPNSAASSARTSSRRTISSRRSQRTPPNTASSASNNNNDLPGLMNPTTSQSFPETSQITNGPRQIPVIIIQNTNSQSHEVERNTTTARELSTFMSSSQQGPQTMVMEEPTIPQHPVNMLVQPHADAQQQKPWYLTCCSFFSKSS